MAILAALFGVLYLFDFLWAQSYKIELVSRTPEIAIADLEDVTFTVRLTRGGKPVAGHNLVVIAQRANKFKSYRETTDENGEAEFVYYTTKFSIAEKGDSVTTNITVQDEDNSIFIAVSAKLVFQQTLLRE